MDGASVDGIPPDFIVWEGGVTRWRRYERYKNGWTEYVWNYEWVFSDDVGDDTVADAWANSEQVAVLVKCNGVNCD
jgi:hypothetical protein